MLRRVTAGVLLFLLASCAQIAGLDEFETARGPGATADAGATTGTLSSCGDLAYAGQDCAACMTGPCCAEVSACAGDEVCKLAQQCYAACAPSDLACRGRCATTVPYFDKAQMQLEHCLVANCEQACPGGVGKFQPLAVASCMNDRPQCAAQEKALWAHPLLSTLTDCELPCRDDIRRGGRFSRDGLQGRDICGCAPIDPGLAAVYAPYRDCADACASSVRAPDWSCLGDVKWPTINNGSEPVLLTAYFGATLIGTPLEGLKARPCFGGDCAAVLAAPGTTNANGLASFSFPRRPSTSSNYFEYIEQSGLEGYYDGLLYLSPPRRRTSWGWFSPLSKAVAMAGLANTGIPFNDNDGFLEADAVDCAGEGVAGVVISADIDAPHLYLEDGASSLSATLSQTASSGVSYFVISKTGIVNLTARLGDRVIAKASVWVRAGAGTQIPLSPSPMAQ